jgi:hypothetical protein
MELEGKLEQTLREKEEVKATLSGIVNELEEKFDESDRMKIVCETQRHVREVERTLRVHVFHCEKLNITEDDKKELEAENDKNELEAEDYKNEWEAVVLDRNEELNEDLTEREDKQGQTRMKIKILVWTR